MKRVLVEYDLDDPEDKKALLQQIENTVPSVNNKVSPSTPIQKGVCSVCGKKLDNPTHTLCIDHWKQKNLTGEG